MSAIARRVQIYGRVQGVFFRQWTVNQARGLGVSGWVRNRVDGSVEAHVEGDEPAVAKLVAALHHGPSQARVEDVTVESLQPEGLSGFTVRH